MQRRKGTKGAKKTFEIACACCFQIIERQISDFTRRRGGAEKTSQRHGAQITRWLCTNRKSVFQIASGRKSWQLGVKASALSPRRGEDKKRGENASGLFAHPFDQNLLAP